MITEDYVSFETAKLLKEKGFDEPCYAYWCENENRVIISQSMHALQNITNPCFFGPATPTLQMAMKWLREIHNIHPSIVVDDFDGKAFYRIEGIFVSGSEHRWVSYYPSDDDKTEGLYSTYEKACEAVIKYCLENLI